MVQIMLSAVPTGCWYQQEGGPHHWHCRGPPPPQQIHRVPATERAEAEGVPLQAHPLPQEGLRSQEGRQLSKSFKHYNLIQQQWSKQNDLSFRNIILFSWRNPHFPLLKVCLIKTQCAIQV